MSTIATATFRSASSFSSSSSSSSSSFASSSSSSSKRLQQKISNKSGSVVSKKKWITPRAEASSSSSSSSSSSVEFLEAQGLGTSSDGAKEAFSKFAQEGGFPVWLPEVVNGRVCMVGLSIGASVEVTQHLSLLEQVPHSLVQLALLGGAIIYASTKPFEFNPQNGYNANPESLEGIRDTPGMLVVEKCNFTPSVEMTHGRIAMTAFTLLCLIELISGKPFFG